VHYLFAWVLNEKPGEKDYAQALYRALKFRYTVIVNILGENASEIQGVQQSLHQVCSEIGINASNTLLQGFRFLPAMGKFREEVNRWHSSGTYKRFLEQQANSDIMKKITAHDTFEGISKDDEMGDSIKLLKDIINNNIHIH